MRTVTWLTSLLLPRIPGEGARVCSFHRGVDVVFGKRVRGQHGSAGFTRADYDDRRSGASHVAWRVFRFDGYLVEAGAHIYVIDALDQETRGQ